MVIVPATILSLILLNAITATVAITIGVAVGWRLFSNRGDDSQADLAAELEKERALMAASQIRDLTTRMAQDVGAHSSAVEQFAAELGNFSEDESNNGDAISAAIAKIVTANESLQKDLQNAESKLEQQADEIAHHQTASLTDSLTGLNNRRAFDQAMKQRFAEWQRKGISFSLMIFDVDHFKKFNDTHGHLAGDEVLRSVGKALSEVTREMDIPCRYGGEEFAVILPDTATNDAKRAVERARKTIEAMVVEFEGKTLRVKASVGLAEISEKDDPAILIRRADDALYAAKEAGRNRSYFNVVDRSVPITPETAPAAKSQPKEKPLPQVKVLHDLADKSVFGKEVQRRVAESQRFQVPLSVMNISIHDFDQIQNQQSPAAVEVVLDSVAQLIGSAIRDMDLLAHTADGRFDVMLPGSTKTEAKIIGQRVEVALANCVIPVGAEKVNVSVSVGLAEFEPGQHADDLIYNASRPAAKKALEAAPVA